MGSDLLTAENQRKAEEQLRRDKPDIYLLSPL
jgi:hypothetical protein